MSIRGAAIIVCMAVATLCLAAPDEEKGEEAMARVNGRAITADEVERFMRLSQPGAPPVSPELMTTTVYEEFLARRKKEAIESLIERHLLCELARQEYLDGQATSQPLDEHAEQELKKLEERAGSPAKARRLLTDLGLNVDQFKQLQIENALATKLLFDKVYSHVHASPTEVRKYYDEHREDFRVERSVVYRQILFVVVDRAEELTQRERAESVHRRIVQGLDFAEGADRYSADSEMYPGGWREVRVPDYLPDWLPPTVVGLEPGQLSGVRRLAGGFSVARLEEVKPARVLPFEEAQPRITEDILQRERAAARAEYVGKLKEEAGIEYLPPAAALGLK